MQGRGRLCCRVATAMSSNSWSSGEVMHGSVVIAPPGCLGSCAHVDCGVDLWRSLRSLEILGDPQRSAEIRRDCWKRAGLTGKLMVTGPLSGLGQGLHQDGWMWTKAGLCRRSGCYR